MADALDLAYAILGSGVAIAGANFTGNEQSAAVFDATDRSPGVGITSGIVLSTGKVDDIYGPNDSDATSIELVNPITTIPENTSTSIAVKVANLSITDDIFGNNTTSLSGSDASSFEIKGNELYLKAGTDLNYNTKNSYSVILSVNDANINNGDSKTFNLSITPVTLPTLSIEATNATQREGDTGIKAFAFTVIRIGDTSSSYTDTNPTLVTATNLGVINERTLSILTSPDTSSFSVGTDPGSNNLVPADVDMYRFELGQAGTISLETSLPQNGAGMDTILRLFDVYGKELGGDDDTGPDFYSRLNAYL
ncbi:choice-of-anchor L domain-containing protein, partial [Cylindrospermopsis raciborskii]|uniref:choice-of-anchor L domain-containing protein n=1 Tax=Cylindrospermopsis raciborskii TaxID=77022 RepID=UPI001F1081F5